MPKTEMQRAISGAFKGITVHGAVFLAMIGVAVLVAWFFFPPTIPTSRFLVPVPPLFALYLGVFTLLKGRRRQQRTRQTTR